MRSILFAIVAILGLLPATLSAQRSGTNRSKGRTRDQLYNEAKSMGLEGRSSMNKDQLQRAVDAKK